MEGFDGHPLGIVLVSANTTCNLCKGALQLCSDQPSYPVIYVSRTHFRKYCQNNWKVCHFTQHYGFHMTGNDFEMVYDHDCLDLPFFLSTHARLVPTLATTGPKISTNTRVFVVPLSDVSRMALPSNLLSSANDRKPHLTNWDSTLHLYEFS